jgi:subtilisin family serine protease
VKAGAGSARQADPRRARSRAIVSPLLRTDSAVDQQTRDRLVRTLDGRQAVLIELRVGVGQRPADARALLTKTFSLEFEAQTDPPAAPVAVGTHYMRASLSSAELQRLLDRDRQSTTEPDHPVSIYQVWPDYVIHSHLDRSVATVKADAATRTYGSSGSGIVWAVVDSGIDGEHPHFARGTLTDPSVAVLHRDFTGTIAASIGQPTPPEAPLQDAYGHGSHVAGIIAGSSPTDPALLRVAANDPTLNGLPSWVGRTLSEGASLTGVASQTRLVSLKVLDDSGDTLSSVVIDALEYVRETNSGGRDLRIHGVNLSLGCDWIPGEFSAGQSPLCREVDLLVGTGVVVVVSAGNSGAAGTVTGSSSDVSGRLSTITDPGNAARAITVGSTHRYKPHTYGVSYDSSKGPTLDGRLKPDLLAPGERITSVATGSMRAGVTPLAAVKGDPAGIACYIEDSGTSMSAAHVSGVIAAFLSARREYVGQPDEIKKLFCASATSLGRHEFFQGAGLIDLMRALSNV